MTIKYEPVFGDMSQFDGMMPDCEFVDGSYGYKNNGDVFYCCERYNEKFGWAFSRKTNTDFRPIAMRRVIKTPTWTRADQEAGVLPPVGAKVGVLPSFIAEVMVTSAEVSRVCVLFDEGELDVVSLEQIYPIETPEEKAQREQEEFVASFNSEKYSNPTLYREGLRDAYRKLKAPTND